MSQSEIKSKSISLKGSGAKQDHYKPDLDTIYSYVITDWIGNYNVVKIDYWIEIDDVFNE